MRTLRLVALSDDGKSLILAAEGPDSADSGERFELPIDDRLRAAARGDARRLTQIDVDLGTELPPRVIQARIRAGETPEQVAAASGTRVERIMRFAHPVIQERARVAEQAREARVRLTEGSPSVALHQFMTDRLRLIDSDIDAVTWDAHRTDDGTWQVTGAWRAGRQVRHDALDLRPARRARSPRSTPRPWTSPRAPAWCASSPTSPPGLTAPGPRAARAVTVVRDAGRADDDLVHDTVTPDVLPSDLAAARRRADPRRAPGRPAHRTTTARSTRCSTRSPSTTPWCSAASGEDRGGRGPAGPHPGLGGHRLRGPPAPLSACPAAPPAKLVRLGQYRRLASAAPWTRPGRRSLARRPGQALRAAPAGAVRPPVPRAARRSPSWPRCSPRWRSSPSRCSRRPWSTGRSPTATAPA